MRTILLLTTLALTVALLAACGDDDGDEFDCDACPVGTTCDATGTACVFDCDACPAGTTCNAAGDECVFDCGACPAGTICNAAGEECVHDCNACPAGTECNAAGDECVLDCDACPAGTACNAAGDECVFDCDACPAGTECNEAEDACVAPPDCLEGAVTERCVCDRQIVETGYCCDTVYETAECSATRRFFVDATGGADSNDGRTPAQAWQTLSKITDSEFIPGDKICLKRGETFVGSIVLTESGSAGAPITLRGYGSAAEKPLVSGFETITGWTDAGGGIYEADANNCTADLNLLVLDGELQAVGRWPNTDWLNHDSHTGNTSITDSDLAASPDWTGAELVMEKNHWTIDRNLITNHDNHTLHYTTGSGNVPLDGDNYGYFIQRDIRTLDQYGEWFFNPGTSKLSVYFGSEVPADHTVQVSVVDRLLDLDRSDYVVVEDLAFEGSNLESIHMYYGDGVTIQRCDIAFSGTQGIVALADFADFVVEDNTITDTQGKALYVGRWGQITGTVVRGNTVVNTGMVPGMGPVSSGYVAIQVNGGASIIEYNEVDEVGYNGIHFHDDHSVVRYNRVQRFCKLLRDGAGIYTWTDDPTDQVGMKILNNIVLSGYDCNGLYSDGLTNHMEVAGNTVAHLASGHGIHMNQPRHNWLHDNTFFDCNGAGVDISNLYLQGYGASDNVIEENLIIASHEQWLIQLRDGQNNIFGFGDSDNNTLVVPYPTVVPVRTVHRDGTWVNGFHQLDDWRGLHGQDVASTWVDYFPPVATVDSLVGSNLASNGDFATDITGWSATTDSGNVTNTWADTGILDGGALEISHDSTGTPTYIRLYPAGNPFAVDATRKYIVRFSIQGTEDERSGRIYLRQKSSPWSTLAPRQYFHFGTTRREQLLVFEPTSTDADCTVVMEWDENDGTVYLDNFEIYEAQVTPQDLATHFRLEYNATQQPKTIALSAPMVDAFGTQYATSVTLQPYTSVILMPE